MARLSLTQTALPLFKAVIDRKVSIPVLQYVLVTVRDGESFGTATNFDRYVSMPVDAGTAPGLYKVIGKELVLTKEPPAGFPIVPTWYSEPFLTVPIGILKASLPFINKEESRYTLNALLIRVPVSGPIVVSATDGHRLRVQHLVNPGGLPIGDYLVPRATVEVLCRHAKGNVFFKFNPEDEQTRLRIVTSTFGMYSRTLTGHYPNYAAVLPNKLPFQIAVLKNDLDAAIKAIIPFVNEEGRGHGVQLDFSPADVLILGTIKEQAFQKAVSVTSLPLESPAGFDGSRYLSNPDHAVSVIMPMRVTGTSQNMIGINILYLQDVVNGIDSDTVFIAWKDGQSSVTVTGHNLMEGSVAVPDFFDVEFDVVA